MSELSEAARRAGSIVTAHVDSIVERTEQHAESIVHQAEHDAAETRRNAEAAADRLFGRLGALETPLEELVMSIRDEMHRAGGQPGPDRENARHLGPAAGNGFARGDEPAEHQDDAGADAPFAFMGDPTDDDRVPPELGQAADADPAPADPRAPDDARNAEREAFTPPATSEVLAPLGNGSPLSELSEASHRAGSILNEYVDLILEQAEGRAEMVRRDAEREAVAIRRDAVTAAERLLSRIEALEFPLGALVVGIRDETERMSRSLESGEHVDSDATALSSAPGEAALRHETRLPRRRRQRPQDRPSKDDEPPTYETHHGHGAPAEPDRRSGEGDDREISERPQAHAPARPPEAEEVEAEGALDEIAPASPAPPDDDAGAPAVSGRGERGGALGLRRSRRGKRPAFPPDARCAVCRHSVADGHDAGAPDEWQTSGDVQLCPTCQADGWQLPEGARLPFRGGRR